MATTGKGSEYLIMCTKNPNRKFVIKKSCYIFYKYSQKESKQCDVGVMKLFVQKM